MTAQLVLPGESLQIPSSSNITLGPGIAAGPSSSSFISTKLGLLRSTAGQRSSKGKEKGTSYWVESNTKRVRSSSIGSSCKLGTELIPSIFPRRRSWC